jgi:hypothetical protein
MGTKQSRRGRAIFLETVGDRFCKRHFYRWRVVGKVECVVFRQRNDHSRFAILHRNTIPCEGDGVCPTSVRLGPLATVPARLLRRR